MDWNQLLSDVRIGNEYPTLKKVEGVMNDKKYEQSAFEKDYSRIINSASFRRLQDKTQVFPLDKSDFIRTRLTHSIETSTIAKQLGTMANSVIKKKTEGGYPDSIRNIPDILMCAGLLHDIGNPPFGHFGENIISGWFSDKLDTLEYKGKPLSAYLSPQMRRKT